MREFIPFTPADRKPFNVRDYFYFPQEGDVVEDGFLSGYFNRWIYVGFDKEMGCNVFAAPEDEPGIYTFEEALAQAESRNAYIPTKGQLDKMIKNKDLGALKKSFNESGSDPDGWYWSSSRRYSHTKICRFSDGKEAVDRTDSEYSAASLRCVRYDRNLGPEYRTLKSTIDLNWHR